MALAGGLTSTSSCIFLGFLYSSPNFDFPDPPPHVFQSPRSHDFKWDSMVPYLTWLLKNLDGDASPLVKGVFFMERGKTV